MIFIPEVPLMSRSNEVWNWAFAFPVPDAQLEIKSCEARRKIYVKQSMQMSKWTLWNLFFSPHKNNPGKKPSEITVAQKFVLV